MLVWPKCQGRISLASPLAGRRWTRALERGEGARLNNSLVSAKFQFSKSEPSSNKSSSSKNNRPPYNLPQQQKTQRQSPNQQRQQKRQRKKARINHWLTHYSNLWGSLWRVDPMMMWAVCSPETSSSSIWRKAGAAGVSDQVWAWQQITMGTPMAAEISLRMRLTTTFSTRF